MSDERDNPLIDALLDESLGGRTPPDLAARIMQAHAARRPVDLSVLPAALPGPPLEEVAPVPPPVLVSLNSLSITPPGGHPVVELVMAPARRAKRRHDWQPVTIAVSLLSLAALAAAIGYYVSRGPQVADKPADNNAGGGLVQNDEPALPRADKSNSTPVDRGPMVAVAPPIGPTTTIDLTPPVAVTPSPHERPLDPPPVYRDPSPDPEVISFVSATLSSAWLANDVKPADPATDDQWCRRVFVRIVGRIPDVDSELRPFVADRSPNKREQLVDRLLSDERYVPEYAHHWASVWANILIGRTGGRGGSLASREGLEQYLRHSLAENKPYDKLVQELLTATGSAEPGTDDYNGAVNFLLDGMSEDKALVTGRVSRIFLGHQLQCAQCHNHPTHDWSQEQFWALNSFFRQMRVEKAGAATRLVNADFGGQRQGSTDGEVYYETPAGLLKSAFPVFLDGTAIPPTGELAQVDRRAELARFVVRSEQLPRALVNRLWAHFFGYGFTQPVDDMSPAGGAAHPELLDRLAAEFAAHDYDLKSLIRWIALSDPFGRSSKIPSLASKDMPEAGQVALFSRYYTRQLPAEEVYNSLVQAAKIRTSAASQAEVEQARVDWLGQFSRPMGTDDGQEEIHQGGISQSLIMMNGELMRRAASGQHAGLLKSVTQSKLPFDKKVEHLFLAALSREPSRAEREMARKILANSKGSELVALEDTWWALLNSNEFILDH